MENGAAKTLRYRSKFNKNALMSVPRAVWYLQARLSRRGDTAALTLRQRAVSQVCVLCGGAAPRDEHDRATEGLDQQVHAQADSCEQRRVQ